MFNVLDVPGFPDNATVKNATPFSVTLVAPVNTGFVSFSIVSNTALAPVTLGAVAVMVTVSLVSFTSSTPVNVTVWFVLQHCTPGHTLSKVNVVVDNDTDVPRLVAIVTVVEGAGSAESFTSSVPVEPSSTVVCQQHCLGYIPVRRIKCQGRWR